MMERLRLGLIGAGWFGQFTLEEYAQIPEIDVTAISDVDPERSRAVAASYGAAAYTDPMELIASPDVDLVVISSPPDSHAPLSIAAARAGKHVFCEKPMAISMEEADEMRREIEETGVRFTINYVLRANPLNGRLRELLRTGIMGPLQHMSLENFATDEPLKLGHWFWDRSMSGGIWIEHGVHFFNLFEWLSGEKPESVAATRSVRHDGVVDRIWSLVRYSNGLTAAYYHGFTQPQRFEETKIRLTCVRGYIEMTQWIQTKMEVDVLLDDEQFATFRRWAETEPEILERYEGEAIEGWAHGHPYRATVRARVTLILPQGKFPAYRESFRANMVDFVKSIRDPRHRPEITIEDGRTSLAVAVAATRAEESGVWEKVPEA